MLRAPSDNAKAHWVDRHIGHFAATHNHWADEHTSLDYLEQVLVPFFKRTTASLFWHGARYKGLETDVAAAEASYKGASLPLIEHLASEGVETFLAAARVQV